MTTKPITHISFNLGPDVGANDIVIGKRVVPNGTASLEVYGRTLDIGEGDNDEEIIVPSGYKLVFPPGSVKVALEDIDKHAEPEPDGYAAIANTVWTWLQIPPSQTYPFFHYMLAIARRLDVAHALYVSTLRQLVSIPNEHFMRTRDRVFNAVSSAESMCIALNRAILMITSAQAKLSVNTRVPAAINAVKESTQSIRNAFEHIDERALGQSRAETPMEAMSIFNQAELATSGRLRYANHVLELQGQVLPSLIAARQFVYDVIADAGTTKTVNARIEFGPLYPD